MSHHFHAPSTQDAEDGGPGSSRTHPMISYAQNAEDVVLGRAFAGVSEGFYVDVGAGHPLYDSVTKHFYDRGWRGVNIEPLPTEARLLEKERPRDVTLEVALSDRPGSLPMYAGPPENRGSSTLDEALANSYRARGQHFEETTVEVTTLQAVLEEHADRPIDFLKIDVEGFEERVLRGVDLSVWRPKVLLVEATTPNTSVASHERWEPMLLNSGFVPTLFDGLNRFYVREEDREVLAPALSRPANIFDDFVPFRFVRQEEELRNQLISMEAVASAAELRTAPDPLAADDGDRSLEDLVRDLASQLHVTQDELAMARDELVRMERVAEAARRLASEESVQRLAAERAAAAASVELSHLLQTRTFRYTLTPRRFYAMLLRRDRPQ